MPTWKVLTGIIRRKLYLNLERNGYLTNEQNRCRKISQRTKAHIIVDKVILKNCRSILVDLSMAWTDIKYGSSFLNPKMFEGAAGNNTTLTNNSMANWRTALTSGGTELG